MLNNQKSSSCKIGLGFDSSKASTSGTKPINFVGSSAGIAPDESTIKAHGSTIPGSVDPSSGEKVAEHIFSPPMSSRSDFVITRKKLIHNKIEDSTKPSLKPSLKRVLAPNKLSPLVDEDVGEEEAIENNTKVVNNSKEEDESIEVDEVVNIKVSKNHPLEQVIEPKNVNEALGDESWVIAMQEELNQFVANDVWDLVPLPMSQTIIGTKWVLKNKLDENGIVSTNKARLVAQGYNQQEVIDYDETYAPVARLESIRILLAIACANDFKLYQMDIKSAFLNGFINEEIYVAQPWGFIDYEKPNYVYKLKKALYGLKQAPKACMTGELNFFLGLQIKQMRDGIFFNQSKYIKEMLKKFGLEDSKPTKTLMSTEIKLTMDDEADSVDSSKYRENPKTTHLEAVKHIFRYIRGTIYLGLWYPKGTRIEIIVYADSDHTSDYVDRKSTSGVCTFMGYFLTSWFAKKQTALAISMTEAKYVSTEKACQQALWMKQALIDYDIRLDDVKLCHNQKDYQRTKAYLPRIHRSKAMDEEVRESYHRLESRLFYEGRFVTPSFNQANNMLLTFQAVVKRDEENNPYIEFKLGQFSFELDSSQLSLILQTPKALETFYTSKWSLDSLDDHPNSRFFGLKHDLVRKNITIPRTTQTQLQKDPNKLHIDDICPELKGWELLFRENFFCTLGNRDHVNACTVYMLYYLTIKKKFNFTSMILYRMEGVKNKRNGPMPFAMLLTRLYNYILRTNPQAIVPPNRFTFHDRVMNPLDI
ncbi:retrovirus-related pol polyprotein from transposon TNT 1-94 [Tanacetum coccineum]